MMPKKILLVDFDAESLNSLSRFIKNEGFQVVTATDGLAGFQKFQEEKPDLVIVEAMLPKLHGFELCARITGGGGKKTPVFILTGVYKESVHKTEAIRAFGASAYFEKPYSPRELCDSIQKALRADGAFPDDEDDLDGIGILDDFTVKTGSVKQANNNSRPKNYRPDDNRKLAKDIEDTLLEFDPRLKKKEKLKEENEDIESILEGTLAGLGFKSGKTKSPPDPNKPVSPGVKKAPDHKTETPPPPQAKPSSSPAEEIPPSRAAKEIQPPAAAAEKSLKSEKSAIGPSPDIAPVPPEWTRPEAKSEPGAGRGEPEPRRQPANIRASAEQPGPRKMDSPASPAAAPSKNGEPEAETAAVETYPFAFGEDVFARKTGGAMRFFVIAAAVLALGGSALMLLKPKSKPPAVLEMTASPADDIAQENMLATPDITQTFVAAGNKADPLPAAPIQDAARTRETAGSSVETGAAAAETPVADLKPILPAARPALEISSNATEDTGERDSASPDLAGAALPETVPAPALEKTAGETGPATAPAPVKASLGDLVKLDAVDVPPQLIKSVEPSYTPRALKFRAQGTIIVNALISEYGDVLQAAVIKSFKDSMGLDKSAENAVRQWKFKPAQKDGVSVRVWKPIVLGFKVK